MIKFIVQAIFSDYRSAIVALVSIPFLITTIYMLRLGHHFLSRKLGRHYRLVVVGAYLSALWYVGGIVVSYIGAKYLSSDGIFNLSMMNTMLGAIGNLLFVLGIYKWVTSDASTQTTEGLDRGPFIS